IRFRSSPTPGLKALKRKRARATATHSLKSIYPTELRARFFSLDRLFSKPPRAAIKAEQIKGRAKSLRRLMKSSPRKLIGWKKFGVATPRTIAETTLIRMSWVLNFFRKATTGNSPYY